MALSMVKVAMLFVVCALMHTGKAQPMGSCECVKKQLVGNCRGICACLVAQGQPVGDQQMCESVCNPCDAEFKSKGCPSDGRMPAACLRPASFGAAVQKCSAVANKQCDPVGGQKGVQTEKAPTGRRLFAYY